MKYVLHKDDVFAPVSVWVYPRPDVVTVFPFCQFEFEMFHLLVINNMFQCPTIDNHMCFRLVFDHIHTGKDSSGNRRLVNQSVL